MSDKLALTLGPEKGTAFRDLNWASCMLSGSGDFQTETNCTYPDLGYRSWPNYDITGHDVTSAVPVAMIVGSRWMTRNFMLILKLP